MSIQNDKIMNLQDGQVLYNDLRKRIEDKVLSATIDTPAPIISFPDGAPYPMRLTAGIDPVQDFHGYDHPWPAGGGKNLIPLTLPLIKSKNTVGTWNNNVYTRNGITYTVNLDNDGNVISITVNGTADGDNPTLILNNMMGHEKFPYSMVLNGCPANGSANTYNLCCQLSGSPWTTLATDIGNGANVALPDNANVYNIFIRVYNGVSLSNKVFYPMLRLATETNPTFAPYTNICPISGFDVANVMVTGKNLLRTDESDWEIGTYNNDGEDFTPSNKRIRTKRRNYIHVIPGQTYTFSVDSLYQYFFFAYDDNDNVVSVDSRNASWIQTSTTITLQSATRFRVAVSKRDGGNIAVSEISSAKVQCELGSSATTYEQFGHIYPITFPTSAGTVYGGTVTVNPDGTGKLVVDKALFEFDGSSDEQWSKNIASRVFFNTRINKNLKYTDASIAPPIISNIATPVSQAARYGDITTSSVSANTGNALEIRYFCAGITDSMDVNGFRTWLSSNHLQVCIDLKNQITYSISAPQVIALLNLNHVWADTGDIKALSYVRNTVPELIRQDTKGQIASALAQVQEELSDTESALAIVVDGDVAPTGGLDSGKYVFLRSHSTLARGLYHTTAAIADGASITENNTEPDDEGGFNSLSGSINTLNSKIPSLPLSVSNGGTGSTSITGIMQILKLYDLEITENNNGSFAGFVNLDGTMYVFFATRVTTNTGACFLVHRYNGQVFKYKLCGSSEYDIVTNDMGTVVINYNSSPDNVYCCAIKIMRI